MMTPRFFRGGSVLLLAAGLLAFALTRRDRPVAPPVEVTIGQVQPPEWESVIPPEASFVIDVAGTAGQLDELREDERREQIADWTAYGVLLHAGLPPEQLREATYDKIPFRHPAFEETANFDYGRGRRVILGDGLVWLFYSDFDADQRRAILGRLADQVRMELGALPSRLCVFRYRSDLIRGVVQVQREPDLQVETAFSETFGYVERVVRSQSDFADWLGAIDDLVHVEFLAGEAVRLGGRRFPETRTAGATLEDVAALYQAHQHIDQRWTAAEQVIKATLTPLDSAYDDLIDAYNSLVGNGSDLSLPDLRSLDARIATVESYLPSADLDASGLVRRMIQQKVGGLGFGALTAEEAAALASQLRSGGTGPAAYKSRIENLRPRVSARLEEMRRDTLRTLSREGRIPPSEPGFSLDPQWNAADLIADLERLVNDPQQLVVLAREIALHSQPSDAEHAAIPREIRRARDLVEAVEGADAGLTVSPDHKVRLAEIVNGLRGKGGKELADGGILPLLQLKEDLKRRKAEEDFPLLAALDFLDALHRVQCARYDGPLRGTRVGMVLFYTDLLAKLWASLDYDGEAPTHQVFGFLSKPRISPDIEPEYWDEVWALPNTRLWFGVRKDGYSSVNDRQLDFSHISARVYSAGSNHLNPGEETTTAEPSRRVFGWWDRHFADVADHEPMYHVQNQIMKWSVATGVLQDRKVCRFLDEVPVNRTLRFDHWYEASNELRFHRPLQFRPESEWIENNETLPILSSYRFPSAGKPIAWIEGGVSLGGARSVQEGSKIVPTLKPALRRGGIDYSGSSATELKSLKGPLYDLHPADDAGRLVTRLQPAPTSRLRSGPTTYQFRQLSTETVSRTDGSEWALQSDAGRLGTLSSRRIPGGTQLDWHPGRLGQDQGLARDALRAFRASHPPEAVSSLAAQEKFLPDKGVFLVADDAGFEAVLVPSSGPRESPPAPSGWRTLRIAEDQAPGPNGWYRLSEVRQAGLADVLAIFEGRRVPIVRAVEEPLEAGFASCTRLNATPWQRLRPLAHEPESALPGRLQRLFTTDEPPPNGIPVTIESTQAADGAFHGVVADGALYVRRPATGPPDAFNTLVGSHGITGKKLSAVIAQAEPGSAPITVRFDGPPPSRVGADAARAVESGDRPAVIEKMLAAAREGRFDEAVADFRRQVRQDGLHALADGDLNPTVRRVLESTSRENAPDNLVLEAVLRVTRSDLDPAVAAIRNAAQGNLPPDASLESFGAIARNRGQAAMADFLEIHSPQVSPVAPEIRSWIELTTAGRRAHTVLKPPGKPPTGPMNEEQVRSALSDGATFYVEDRGLLGRLDWDAAPGHTLGQLVNDPRVTWSSLSMEGLGRFRPTRIAAEDTSYLLRHDTAAKAGTSSPADAPYLLRPPPLVLLRNTETNAVSEATLNRN